MSRIFRRRPSPCARRVIAYLEEGRRRPTVHVHVYNAAVPDPRAASRVLRDELGRAGAR